MEQIETVMELVANYEAYTTGAEELAVSAAADAPATSAPCGAAGVSWIVSQFSGKTISEGC
ncbi:LxmA leader domain family RiPP [Actinoplanes xinjiangensis]|uniref:Uncharacterized protein n=1 Tax=Actinoplanes xinjiangensis TaxID=512350 RepID=A0A316FCW1_9ACTN|nr:LxmA leader domain family RiPP [Actinoplanes xinjiangensis]PWK46731.1 hypothetical protein BC793_109302 [Actinoplanes xinjiangensis]GIF40446.1 hypothetical protein Axi01nite_47570 [Actinoplanes xinjiangensis]